MADRFIHDEMYRYGEFTAGGYSNNIVRPEWFTINDYNYHESWLELVEEPEVEWTWLTELGWE